MQLSLFALIVIVSLLANIVLTNSKEENKETRIPMKDSTGLTNDEKSKDENFASNDLNSKNCLIDRRNRRIYQPRSDRRTYVKAILSNPNLTESQNLAGKLARAELESPKMQETFRKLTGLISVKKRLQEKSDPSKLSSSKLILESPKNFPYKVSRFKGPRKKKKKRHKSVENVDKRRENRNRRKNYNHRSRISRQVPNSLIKNNKKTLRDRYGKSLDYKGDRNFDRFNDHENFQRQSYGNLNTGINYPGIEDPDANFQLSSLDKNNALNYDVNYSPIGNRNYDPDITNSIGDYPRDFSLENDRFSNYPFISPVDNFYKNARFNGNANIDPSRNRFGIESNHGFSNSNKFLPNRVAISGEENLNNRFKDPRIEIPNSLGQRNDNDDNYSSNLKNPSGLPNATDTTKNISTTDLRKNPETGSTSKLENLISGKADNSTTETSAKTKRIGGDSEGNGKKMEENKYSKRSDYYSLPMTTNFESLANMEKLMQNPDTNSAEANETKEVAEKILNKIIEELEDLKMDRNKNDHREGLPCKLSGSWITTQAGVRIDISVTNHRVNVSVAKLSLPVGTKYQGLLNYTWNITGYAPFKRGGPFSLVATDNRTKSLAVFVGACRVCQGVDTIEGVWSIAREPRDCRDFQMATSIYNDIFRKTELLSAIKEKQSGTSKAGKHPRT